MSEDTGFSLLRKNIRKTLMRLRENIGLKGEPILQRPIFRREPAYERRPRREESIEYDEVRTFSDDEGRTLRAYYNNGRLVYTEEIGEGEISTATAQTVERPQSSIIEDIINYRRKFGILSSIRRGLRAAALKTEQEIKAMQDKARQQEVEELRRELKRAREEIRRLSGHHY
jgi:hypothetical protein